VRIVSKYAVVHGLLEPALMSPRCTTISTFGSLLINAKRPGASASLAGPYGKSPNTARVYASLEPVLTGLPVVNDGVVTTFGSVVDVASLLHAAATNADTARYSAERVRDMESSESGLSARN
jgi:hypothetical protein